MRHIFTLVIDIYSRMSFFNVFFYMYSLLFGVMFQSFFGAVLHLFGGSLLSLCFRQHSFLISENCRERFCKYAAETIATVGTNIVSIHLTSFVGIIIIVLIIVSAAARDESCITR